MEPVTMEQLTASKERLRAFVRAKEPGQCKVLSLGEQCRCPLCDVDALFVAASLSLQLTGAINRGGADLSLCMDCGKPVVCLPDGMPMCESCAEKQE